MPTLHEAYRTPSEEELFGFAERLDLVADRFIGGTTGEADSASVEYKIGFGDGELWRLGFEFDCEGDWDSYKVTTKHALPVTYNSGPAEVIEKIRAFNGLEGEDVEVANDRLSRQFGQQIDLNDHTEGFIEFENSVLVKAGKDQVRAKKRAAMNILDEDLEEVETDILFEHGTIPPALHAQYFSLEDGRRVMLREKAVERDFSRLSRADLVLCVNSLIRVGLLHPNTIAFRGAKQLMPLFMPKIYPN